MREYVVTLHSGTRYTVKADRLKWESGYITLTVAPPPAIGDLDPLAGVVAMFEGRQVAAVVVREHLVSEEKGDPVAPHFVDSDPDSDIPF